MSKETDYIKLCKSLRKDSPCAPCQTDNKYVCAHILVKRYVNNDLNKLKKLKAESQSGATYNEIFNQSISLCALLCSIFSIILSFVEDDDRFLYLVLAISVIIIMVTFIFIIIQNILINQSLKYHNYLDIAIEDLEKELTSL